MMFCYGCDRLTDTDDCTGIFEDADPWRFFCESCIENKNDAALDVIQKQDPDLYKELTSE